MSHCPWYISMMFCVIKKKKNAFSSWYQQYQCSAMSENELQQPPAKHKTLNKLSYKQENCSWIWKQQTESKNTLPNTGYEGSQAEDTSSRWCATLKLNKWRVFLEHSIVIGPYDRKMDGNCRCGCIAQKATLKNTLISNLLCDNIVQRPATGTLWQ